MPPGAQPVKPAVLFQRRKGIAVPTLHHGHCVGVPVQIQARAGRVALQPGIDVRPARLHLPQLAVPTLGLQLGAQVRCHPPLLPDHRGDADHLLQDAQRIAVIQLFQYILYHGSLQRS